MYDVCRTCNNVAEMCVRRVKYVQQTTVEKFENIFKNSSGRKKVRQSEEATRRVFTDMEQDVAYVCRTCNKV